MGDRRVFLPAHRLVSFPPGIRVRLERLGQLLPDYDRAALEVEARGAAGRLLRFALDCAIERYAKRPPTGADIPADGLPTTEDTVPRERAEV